MQVLKVIIFGQERTTQFFSNSKILLLSIVPSGYPAGFTGLEFSPYATRAGAAILDYAMEPSILGEGNYFIN